MCSRKPRRDDVPGIRNALLPPAKEPPRFGCRRPLGPLGNLIPGEFAAQASAGFRAALPLSGPLVLERPAMP